MVSNKVYCSCVECHNIYTNANINKHFISAHTQQFFFPKKPSYRGKCLYCSSEILSYSKKKFCNHSCAASYNNKKRKISNWTLSDLSKQKISRSLTSYHAQSNNKVCKISFCVSCGILIKNSDRKTCSKNCYLKLASINSINQKNRNHVKRSKDEIELFNLCKQYFNNVSNNERLFNGWDADILIYDYKIAILWNGPWHYTDMPGLKHSLKQVQNRDKIKQHEIEKAGWKCIVFEDRYYTPQTALTKLVADIGI